MRYEIDEDNAVKVYQDGEDVPFLFQPNYPNRTPFESQADAEEWAKLYVESMLDDSAPYAPQGKGLQGEPKQVLWTD